MVKAVLNYNPVRSILETQPDFLPCFTRRKIPEIRVCSQATTAIPSQFLIGLF